ncbi:Holliday junction branch migration protein RuvA [Paenibacillus larvae]|nr:Holliday junction branch migration protein RuvA [Paenibacillus larvae]AQR77583.1 Holliday junction branch migration protein RuvA [Paenibacillus larvae subsp. larvae]AVF21351.1 holliday junction ATP-dependent DNA helicase RuvA [Paenibacillus larvae subsp. larvae]ETK30139.1 holliday junction ATP-dependent DNA helicase RuvA [Paenibacillus larvae subsp. larvae DSM 25719]MCY7477171.1 Holliday junction branch migration protein RuvA [Paenibacillus larvae]MCY7491357.1 Holliday junction branch migra
MIDYLRGQLAVREMDYVVIDVHGVGYQVFCSNPFGISAREGEEVTLFIHYHVREDAHLLFGFTTREEQTLFRKLIEVSGIGPKVALGILTGGRPDAVIAAIQQENVGFLTKLPGIGKKTAQRIILDLKDKLGLLPASIVDEVAVLTAEAERNSMEGCWAEAKQALLALGYTETEADRTWHLIQKDVKPADPVDTVTKLALKALFQGL